MKKRLVGFIDDIVFPGGCTRAFTMSYDDGTIHDRRFVEILNRHHIKATFNLNSCFFGIERQSPPGRKPLDTSVIAESEVQELYKGHEIAGHGYTHVSPTGTGSSDFMYETIRDKAELERITGKLVRGYAWPYGHYDEKAKEILRLAGYHYARAVETTDAFGIPDDFLEWKGTAHHNNEKLMELAEDFCRQDGFFGFRKKLFYVWGHSYEFELDQSWDKIEAFCKYMDEHREGIWFASNIEIAEYVEAYRRLEYAAEGEMIYNPSAVAVSFNRMGTVYTVNPGETIITD